MRARALLGLALLPAATAGCGGGHASATGTRGGGTPASPSTGAGPDDRSAPAPGRAVAPGSSASTELLGRGEPVRRDPTLVRFVRTSGLYPRTDVVDIDRRGHVVVHTLPSGGRRRTVRLTLSAARFGRLQVRLRRLQADPAPDADLDPRRYVYTVQVGTRVSRVFASGLLSERARPALTQLNGLVEQAYRAAPAAGAARAARDR